MWRAAVIMSLIASQTSQEAEAAIVIHGPTRTTTGTLEITQDLVYTITTNLTGGGGPWALVMDGLMPAGSIDSGSTYSDLSSPLVFLLNGNPLGGIWYTSLLDNVTGGSNSTSKGDAFFYILDTPNLVAGDKLTLKAGSFILGTTSSIQGTFNPLSSQTFTGDTFIVNVGAVRISNLVPAPEPGSALLGSASCGLLLLRRRRSVRS